MRRIRTSNLGPGAPVGVGRPAAPRLDLPGPVVVAFAAFAALAALAFGAPAPASAQSSGFGNHVVVTGPDEMLIGEPNSAFRPGLVYVYRKSGGSWESVAELSAPDAERQDGFGAVLAVSGNTLFVAQRGGRVHTFAKQGGEWSYTGTPVEGVVEGLDPGCNAYGYCGNEFGLALAAEGDWLLVGEPGVPAGGQARRRGGGEETQPTGAVYAFRRDASGGWVQAQRLEAPAAEPGDAFGASVAVEAGVALIGAPGAAGTGQAGEPGAMEDVAGDDTGVEAAGRVFEYRLQADAWQRAGELRAAPVAEARFGSAVALEGDKALVGAPGTEAETGAAFLFRRTADGSWTEPFELLGRQGGDRLGAAVAIDGDHLWVGAPVDRGIENGMAFVYSGANGDPTEERPGRITFTEEETNAEDLLGLRVAAEGGVAAVTAAGLDHGAGGVFVYERDGSGNWRENGLLVSPPDALPAMVGEERRCPEEGSVEVFDCQDVELLSYVPISMLKAEGDNRGVRMNDNWGWTDPVTGREYAIVGRNDGTSFVDITEPSNPVLVGDLPATPGTPQSQLWRDIKTYEGYAYVVADGAGEHGMQIFDLSRLRDVTDPPAIFEPDALYRGEGPNEVGSTHNVIINEETGFAYLTSGSCGGMHMVDLSEPLEPEFAGCTDEGGTHDAQCLVYEGPDQAYQGREICLRMSGGRFQISDVTNKSNPEEVARTSHPNPAYMHQGWVTPDHRYFIMDDESDVIAGNVETTRTLIWDISDLEDPQLVEEFMGSMPASAHNLYVVGDFTYQANYRYGLHILDTSDPLNPVEVGYFDTAPYQEGPGFSGAWSVYPFFDSGSIVITSMQEGLFVLKKRDRPIS